MPDFVLPTADDWDRISRTVREAESNRSGRDIPKPGPHPPSHHDVVIKVTGARIAVTTTTSTTTTTTSSTTSSTTSTTTSTTISNKYLYPGKVVYRRFGTIVDQHWWESGTGDIYVQECNNQLLNVGDIYSGAHFIGTYAGRGVFAVNANDNISDVELCQVSGDPIVVEGIAYIPALVKRLDKNGGGVGIVGWITKVAVWLVQRYNFPLSIGFAAMAKRVPDENNIPTYTIVDDTRMVYYSSDIEWCPPTPTTTTTSTTTTSSTSTSSSSTSDFPTSTPE